MLQTSLDGILAIDQHGRIIEFNPAAERTFGWHRDQAVGRDMADLIIPSAQRERHRQGLARYLATGEGRVLDRRVEMTAMRADGREFPVELTITHVPNLVPPVFVGYVRDITDRKRTELRRAVELAVARVLAQAQTAQDGMQGILRAVCETLEWDVGAIWTVDDQAAVLRCADFWSGRPEPISAFEAATRERTFASGVGLPGRVWASGQPSWIAELAGDTNFPRAPIAVSEGLRSAFAVPIALGGRVVGVVEFFSRRIEQPDPDLIAMMAGIGGHIGQFLEQKRSDAALRDADRRKDEFLATLAHELRTPLWPIGSALGLLRQPAPDQLDQARGVIERQLALLVRLVEDLLDVSRITLNKIELRRTRVSLTDVVQSALETSMSLPEAARRHVTVDMPGETVWLDADPLRLSQVVANLVNNAIKFTRPGGQISVVARECRSEAVITVQDDGIGIPTDMLNRVFDLFVQESGSRPASHGGGLGIGLTVVKDLVEMHGGRVSAHSAGPDRGAIFTVWVPVAARAR